MKRFHQPFVALLLSLLLLGSQQAAFAHLLGHLPGGASPVAKYQGDHGAFDGVAETCVGCIAVAAQAASAPPPTHPQRIASFVSDAAVAKSAASPPSRPYAGAQARAPPLFL